MLVSQAPIGCLITTEAAAERGGECPLPGLFAALLLFFFSCCSLRPNTLLPHLLIVLPALAIANTEQGAFLSFIFHNLSTLCCVCHSEEYTITKQPNFTFPTTLWVKTPLFISIFLSYWATSGIYNLLGRVCCDRNEFKIVYLSQNPSLHSTYKTFKGITYIQYNSAFRYSSMNFDKCIIIITSRYRNFALSQKFPCAFYSHSPSVPCLLLGKHWSVFPFPECHINGIMKYVAFRI